MWMLAWTVRLFRVAGHEADLRESRERCAGFVDKFVDILLRNGSNLDPDDIFYTSGEDTGIPSGADLIGRSVRRLEKRRSLWR